MTRAVLHCNSKWRLALLAVCVCLLAGCWQKVRYVAPGAATAQEGSAPTALDSAIAANDAGRFGDELAATLAATDTQTVESRPVEPPDVRRPISPPTNIETPKTETASAEPRPDRYSDTRYQPPDLTSNTNPTPGNGLPQANIGRVDSTPMEPTTPAVPIATAQPPETGPPAAVAKMSVARTRAAAWLLGSKWSFAVLARDRHTADDKVAPGLAQAGTLADMLGVKLSELPPVPVPGQSVSGPRSAVNYLSAEGQRLGRDLNARYGPDHAALLEMAVKSNLLLVMYEPDTPAAEAIAAAVSQASERAQLPAPLVEPLLSAIKKLRGAADVRQIVYKLHADVNQFLAGAVEQSDRP